MKFSGEVASSIDIPCSMTSLNLAATSNFKDYQLTVVIDLEAYIVRTLFAAADLILHASAGEDVIEVRRDAFIWSEIDRRIWNWRQRLVLSESAGGGSRKDQAKDVQRRRSPICLLSMKFCSWGKLAEATHVSPQVNTLSTIGASPVVER